MATFCPITSTSDSQAVTASAATMSPTMATDTFWIFVCSVAAWIKQAAFRFAYSSLDLDTVSTDLDTIVRATTRGVAGDEITVAGIGDNDALTKASLAMAGPSTLCDTVIEAAVGGADGNDATIAFVADGTGAGTLDESGWPVVVFHYETLVTTVTNFESAIAGSTNLDVKTGGTGANVLADPGDTFAATSLAGGLDSEGVTIVEDLDAKTVVIHWADGESTVDDVETAIAADATLIAVLTTGTGVTVLGTNDDFVATALDGGDAEDAELATAADGSMYVPAGVTFILDGTAGARLSVIRAAGDGTASLTRAKKIP
jgi:hypothetical protein